MSPTDPGRTPVVSSLLKSIAYSIDTTLDLEFRSGATYRYFAVPQSVFEALLAAESKGAFFNRNVRNRFPYQRLA
jgi:hypothetical protein